MGKRKRVTYEAAGGVVIDDNAMLLLERPSRNEIRLPKGHIEPGEAATTAALRETAEEAGYTDLEIIADLGEQVVEFDYQGEHIVRNEHYYLMRKRSEQQTARSAKDAAQFLPRWVSLADAIALLTYPAEQAVAQRALTVIDRRTKSC